MSEKYNNRSGADIEETVDYGREAERKRIIYKLRT